MVNEGGRYDELERFVHPEPGSSNWRDDLCLIIGIAYQEAAGRRDRPPI